LRLDDDPALAIEFPKDVTTRDDVVDPTICIDTGFLTIDNEDVIGVGK
jgi:hypothetical protein